MAHCRILWVQTGSGQSSASPGPPPRPPEGLNLARTDTVHCVSEVSPEALVDGAPDLIILSHTDNRAAALRAVRDARALCARVPILFMAGESCESLAIEAFHAGVTRYLRHPWTVSQLNEEVREIAWRAELSAANGEETAGLNATCAFVGNSPTMCELRRYIRQIAPCDTNVLITGETGTGKELVAQLIHENSGRRYHPFVCLNSAAIPDSLFESEMFGYERGAFTGAQTPYEGKLASANRGTAFLDEIGDISPAVQAKILRAIESKRICRLGRSQGQDLDIRILAATNRNLETATEQSIFRSDLYYRLSVLRVEIPPLRERAEDIPPLVDHYIRHFNAKFRKNVTALRPGSMDLLTSYQWPGNVRELKNLIEAVFANLPCVTEGPIDLPLQVLRQFSRSAPFKTSERTNLLRALSTSNWNKSDAAKALHCSRMTLYRKMNRYKVSRPSPEPPH